MNCIPLKPGVWAIAILQLMYGSVRVYMGDNEHLLHELYPPEAWCVAYNSLTANVWQCEGLYGNTGGRCS